MNRIEEAAQLLIPNPTEGILKPLEHVSQPSALRATWLETVFTTATCLATIFGESQTLARIPRMAYIHEASVAELIKVRRISMAN
ncbi:hypothetical protein ACFY19_34615 [Streptosporangium saharense]|uniref:hypothetical protein n=1 Tax=Streptosporangium saharense TaxID=1706840 RepID=UPI0036888FB0